MVDANVDESNRPNIRIQIHNNLTKNEEMEVDNEENEDGEIIEADEEQAENSFEKNDQSNTRDKVPIAKDIFTTGINIFDKEEQKKLHERARRFALKPEEIRNFTDADLSELHESLGIISGIESTVRFEAVHVLGIRGMTVEDLLEYFASYAPAEIEWIDNNSCNVTWVDNISAARAIFYNSKAVIGMPAREPVNTFAKEFLDDVEDEPTGQSILLKNREVELKIDDFLNQNKSNLKNAVDISEIKVAIPPGYWRLGKDYPITNCLLLRFALKTDKKPYKVENLGKYYKKLGSKMLISENRKKELRSIFERNKELINEKNPWGSIAKNWDKDFKFCEPEREPDAIIETVSTSLQVRLGKKKEQIAQVESEFHVDDEVGDKNLKLKKSVPRMRMYADEEEEKVRRRKLLQTLKNHSERFTQRNLETKDLRNVLRLSNKTSEEVIEIDSESDEIDLGSRLKSRTKKMVFTVKRDPEDFCRKENRKKSSPLTHRKRITPPNWSPERTYRKRSRSPISRYKSPVRRGIVSDRLPHDRKLYGTLHSDRIMTRYKRRRRDSNHSEDGFDKHKPKSRVAIVVKKPKKPTVASTIWSRVHYESDSSTRSDSSETEESSSNATKSSSEESETDSETGSESEEQSDSSSSHGKKRARRVVRPGFQGGNLLEKVNHRTPLKITMANDKIKS